MTNRHDGGPAYPSDGWSRLTVEMSLRDAAAIAAMQAIVTGYMSNSDMTGLTPQMIANESFQYADAMLAARSEAKP